MSFHTARVAPEKADFRPALPLCSLPGSIGRTMKDLTYSEQLRHPNWQRKRLECLEYASWECQQCGEKEKQLQVHHRQYFKGRMAWEYETLELMVVCDDCHVGEHKSIDAMKYLQAITDVADNLAILAGFHATDDWIDPTVLSNVRESNPLTFAAGFGGYLFANLPIDDQLRVAQFAVSLMHPEAEPRLHFEFSRGNTFGELGAVKQA